MWRIIPPLRIPLKFTKLWWVNISAWFLSLFMLVACSPSKMISSLFLLAAFLVSSCCCFFPLQSGDVTSIIAYIFTISVCKKSYIGPMSSLRTFPRNQRPCIACVCLCVRLCVGVNVCVLESYAWLPAHSWYISCLWQSVKDLKYFRVLSLV